jgi:hypothetical protein
VVSPASSQPPEPAAREFAAPASEASYVRWPPPPPKRDPSPRRTLTIIASVLAGSVLLAVLCAGAFTFSIRAADGDLTTRSVPTVTDPPTLPPPSAHPFTGVYTVPRNLCESSDFTRLRPLFNTIGDISPSGPDGSPPAVFCDGSTGNETTDGAFHLVVTVYPSDADAIEQFRASYANRPADVANLGQGAWALVDAGGVHTVSAIDYNLIITMSWHRTGGTPPPSQQVIDTLVNVERSTLRVLRIG